VTTIPVIIDRSSPVPLYHQLAEQLTAVIENGTLKPGDAFENELALADRLDLSRPTVRRAIAELVGRGLLVRRRGVGTTVANQVIHRRDELTSLYDDLDRRGSKPTTTILAFDPARVDARAAAAMGLPADTPTPSPQRSMTSPRQTSPAPACMPCCGLAGSVPSSPTRRSAHGAPSHASASCSNWPPAIRCSR
jgi:DNA-binding GntR family transcriptional regulator